MVQAEYQILADIQSAYTPKPFCVSTIDDKHALAMEYVEGETLEKILKRSGTIKGDSLIRFSNNLFDAVASIHPKLLSNLDDVDEPVKFQNLSTGFIHRDLKPENIIITDATTWQLKLIDLQLATLADRARMTKVGTPSYLPPDWGVTRWDVTFDLYAIGKIFLRCVTGSLVEYDEIIQLIQGLPIEQDYKEGAWQFFLKALSPVSEQRFESVTAMRTEWEYVLLAFAK